MDAGTKDAEERSVFRIEIAVMVEHVHFYRTQRLGQGGFDIVP
jgi:hypothetical protein